MKKVITTTTRKVYATQSHSSPQTTTVRRLNHSAADGSSPVILNSGTPRILKQSTVTTRHVSPAVQSHGQSPANVASSTTQLKCYVCDSIVGGQGSLLMETQTSHSHTKLPNKISRVIGDAFLVIVRADDIVCRRCVNLFNDVDRLESDLERAKGQLMTFICKKYSIEEDGGRAPAAKVQKISSDHLDATSTPAAAPIVRKVVSMTGTTVNAAGTPNGPRRVPVKIYKCMSCDFTTGDLQQFTPHYAVCPGVSQDNNGTTTVVAAAPASSSHAAAASNQNSHSNSNSPQVTTNTSSPSSKVLARRPLTQSLQQAASVQKPEFSCTMCQYKNRDKQAYDEHVRRHIRAKPFKCRICSMRFETRETASKHARNHSTEYYKCGTCSQAFRERETLVKHFEVHQKDGSGGQQIIIKTQASSAAAALAATSGTTAQPTSTASTQKLLQETIDEALRESAAETLDAKNIHFFSCGICSLTFIQENYYTQHMETHKRESATTGSSKRVIAKGMSVQPLTGTPGIKTTAVVRNPKTNGQSLIKPEMNDELESIFEKMHSEKTGGGAPNESAATEENTDSQTGIDMPALDQGEEIHEETASAGVAPVSMPSLDDDGENAEQQAANASAEGGEPMDIEDMHNSVEGGEQLKFIVNENGQLLQLDNHILTDAEGNQIIVQGADSEHLQQLLQSVAGLEGGTIQMIQGENNQMILVQQGDNELLDASLLNADGQIVIQQGAAEGEMSVDGHSQSSEDVAAAVQQQQQQPEQLQQGEYEAGDEAVAVLAAAAEQHHLQATENSAVDESSQEDLETQIAVHTVATTSGAQRDGGESSMQSGDNSQEAVDAASTTEGAGDGPVSGGGTVDGGGDEVLGSATEDDASQESHDQGKQAEKIEIEKSPKGEETVSTTTTDEKITSSTKEEGYRFY